MASTPTTPDGALVGDTYRLLDRIAELVSRITLHCVIIIVAVFYPLEPGAPRTGIVITSALAAYSVSRLVLRQSSATWAVLDVVAVSVYLMLTPWLVVDASFTSGTSAMLAIAGTTVIANAIGHGTGWSVVVTVVIVLAWSLGIARSVGGVAPWSMFSLDFLVVEWALAAWCRRLIVRAAVVTDGVLAGIADDEVIRSVAVARHRLARQQFAVMHDTAASTLLMVGQGAATNRDALARQADRDLAAIARIANPVDGSPVQVALLARLRTVVAGIRTPVSLSGDATEAADRDIADALAGATHEALTNVDRHAHATAATVVVAHHTITITDDGIGFDPLGEQVARRFGVRNSIRNRLADIGGYARLESAPGRGTTVTLRWGRPAPTPERIDPVQGVATTSRLLRGFGYGLFAISLVLILLQSTQAVTSDADHPVAQIVIVVVAVGCALVAGLAVERQVPRWLVAIAYVACIVLACVQQMLLPTASLTLGSNWALWALGWVVVALTYRSSIGFGLGALGVFWVIGATVLLIRDPSADVVATLGYNFASVAVIQALAVVFTTFLVMTARNAHDANEERTRRWAAEAGERALADDVAARYAALSKSLVPLLHKLSDPSVDANDPSLRLAAVIEGARLRRLFAQTDNDGHPLLQELQPTIAAAEDRGVAVSVDAGTALPHIPPAQRDRLLAMVSMMLAAANSRARVVFTAEDGAVTASVVADCDERIAGLESELGVAPVQAGELTWAEVAVVCVESELQGSTR